MTANQIKANDDALLIHKMERFCAFQERCSSDVAMKLRGMEVTAAAIEKVIRRLKEDKFLDDERFTRLFVRGKFRISKWGRIKIRHELTSRGIAEKLISKAMAEEIDEEQYTETIRNLALKKKREIKVEKKLNIRDKILNFVVSKGYEFDRVLEIVNELKIKP
jgi:regulatory protein